MPECRKKPQAVENDLGVDGLEVVQLSEILDRGHSALVVFEVVSLEEHVSLREGYVTARKTTHLKTKSYVFENSIGYTDREV